MRAANAAALCFYPFPKSAGSLAIFAAITAPRPLKAILPLIVALGSSSNTPKFGPVCA